MCNQELHVFYANSKECLKCHVRKNNENFFITHQNYRNSYCKECCREMQKKIYNEQSSIKQTCVCGSITNQRTLKKHLKTKKHQNYVDFMYKNNNEINLQ